MKAEAEDRATQVQGIAEDLRTAEKTHTEQRRQEGVSGSRLLTAVAALRGSEWGAASGETFGRRDLLEVRHHVPEKRLRLTERRSCLTEKRFVIEVNVRRDRATRSRWSGL